LGSPISFGAIFNGLKFWGKSDGENTNGKMII